MIKIFILLFTYLALFSTFGYLSQTISSPSLLDSAHAQKNIDLNGIWEREDKVQINIKQVGSEVIATSTDPATCQEGGLNDADPYLEFKGTIGGNQVIGKESSWCYSGSLNPDENGLFMEPFHITISEDGNLFTKFATSRFTGKEMSGSYSRISGPVDQLGDSFTSTPSQFGNQALSTIEQQGSNFTSTPSQFGNQALSTIEQQGSNFTSTPSQFGNQALSTIDKLRETFTSTLSQNKEPLASLQENNISPSLLLAGLGVIAIGGTAAYVKHRSSKKSQEQANIDVITRGGIE